jgi:hypothetical protein
MQSCEEWLELIRDLNEPIRPGKVPADLHLRWAHKGDRCLLLGSMLEALSDMGCSRIISGMYSNWEASIGLHKKLGFRVHRRLDQCKILNIFPTPSAEKTGNADTPDQT